MKKFTTKIMATLLLLVVVVSSIINKTYKYESNISNDVLRASNIVDKKDINDELLDSANQGLKNINIFVDNNTISFDKSNTVTELSYGLYNIIANSDKETWSIVTNNLVNNFEVINNEIKIKDDFKVLSFSFVYNSEEFNLSLVKNVDKYVLVESTVKLMHGGINSLWYEYFYDLDTAIKAANDNDVIVLNSDIEVNKTIDINKNITITSKPGNIYTLVNNKNYVFNLNNNKLVLNNVLINTDSFVKGKTNSIELDNTKVVYKNRLFPKKSTLNKKVQTKDTNVFNKASL